MRLPKVAGWLRAGACSGLICAIAAGLVSFAWPDQYVSSALLRFRPRYVPEQALERRKVEILLRLNDMVSEVLSRTSLGQIIQSPNIDLYARARRSSPMEEVIDTMRKHVRLERNDPAATLRISFEYADAYKAWRRRSMKEIIGNMRANDLRIDYPFKASNSPGPILPVRISFTYPDRFKAQAVVREVVTRIFEVSRMIGRRRARGETSAGPMVVVALDPTSLPKKALFPQSAATMAGAAGAGALLAWVVAFLRRRPQG